MSSENSGGEDQEEYQGDGRADDAGSNCTDDVESWRDDLQWRMKQESDFLAQLRARRQRSANSSQATSDNEQEG